MEETENQLIYGKPAGYSKTSAAEIDSRNILQRLLDPRFVKGEIRVLDKVPNSDGILEITDLQQYPIGKIDIQLKTLQPKNYTSPSYQCERSFLAYCRNSSLPVILIVVNRKDKKAYWRHIDLDTLSEVSAKITGESYRITIPVENCINGVDTGYIQEWTNRAKEAIRKVWNYDSLQKQKKNIEIQLKAFENKLQDPTKLPLPVLKYIHNFLDKYNYILDIEFASVKEILYPDYWKIGIGIIKFEYSNIRYILFPIEYKKEQTLIKEVIFDEGTDIGLEMMNRKILVFSTAKNIDDIINFPFQTAYKRLEDSILSIAGKYNFPIDDDFIAHEYLVSFIDRNHVYLDMVADLECYSLQELKFKLHTVLPMLAATTLGFADWVTECNHSIDSYSSWKTSSHFKKKIADSIKKIEEGFVPKVKVTITSELYNIDLIINYINHLQNKGITHAKRQYQQGQFDEKMCGVDFWKTWHTDILWENVKTFLKHFHIVYEKFISSHFEYLKDCLRLVESNETTIVYVFQNLKTNATPYIEVYHLRPFKKQAGQVLCFLAEDINNPINREDFFIKSKYECRIGNENYQILLMRVQTLDFMFKISPTYALINATLQEKLKEFFAIKKRNHQ